jgi:hypothetical protein
VKDKQVSHEEQEEGRDNCQTDAEGLPCFVDYHFDAQVQSHYYLEFLHEEVPVEILSVSFSHTIGYPRTMMVVSRDTPVTFPAMF